MKGVIAMKITVARDEKGCIKVDLLDENLSARSVIITAKEGEDGGIELEVAAPKALIIISEGEVTVTNKYGDEVTVMLPD
jgi:hypothetical protein